MERAKTIIIVGIGALAALTIYGAASTKKASAENDRSNRLARIEALMNEGTAKYRPSFFRRAVKRHAVAERLAGLDPVEKTVTEVAPTAPQPKPDLKAEEAKKAAEKKAADDKKKKEDEAKKKKKKKKKKKAGDTSVEEATPDQAANDDDEEKKDNPTAVAATGGTTVSYYAQAPVDPNKLPETVEEWIAYLTIYPSDAKTNKFIQLAQVSNVKGETFFPVCEKLLSMDSRLQEYGVMALGSVASVTSFEYLANVANEVTFTDKLKNQANAYMNQYARVEYVRFVGAAVLSKDSIAANNAVRIIERSLPTLRAAAAGQSAPAASTTAVDPSTTGATTTAGTTPAPAAVRAPASSIGKIYEIIYQNLAQAAQTGSDSSVRSASGIMASQIQSLLTDMNPAGVTATAQN